MLCKRWGALSLLLGSQHFNRSAVVASWTLWERGSTVDEDEETMCTSSNGILVNKGLACHTSSHFQGKHVGMARVVGSPHTCQSLAHYSYPDDSPSKSF